MGVADCTVFGFVVGLLSHSPWPPPEFVGTIGLELVVTTTQAGPTEVFDDVIVTVALPIDDSRQCLEGLTFSEPPDRLVDDEHGNRLAVFRRASVRGDECWKLGYTTRARLEGFTAVVDRSRLQPLQRVAPEVVRYLADGAMYRLEDPRIEALALATAPYPADALELLERLDRAVRERLTYRLDGLWDDAPRVLTQGHGSCSEYAFSLMALCRRRGLAARYVGATVCRSAPPYQDTIQHRFVEVFLPGYGWFPVDPSRDDGEPLAGSERHFGRIDAPLLRLFSGDGGPAAPLGFGYVASVRGRPSGSGRLGLEKSFRWSGRPTHAANGSASTSASASRSLK